MSWPSIIKALIAAHRTDTGVQTGTKVPADVEQLAGFVRMARGPGTDDMVTDAPLIDVECFSTDYGTAEALAEETRQWFHRLNGRRIGVVLVDRARTSVSPAWVDYRNPATNRFVASYRIEFRQQFDT
ncbi:hypothetical protein [Arthrobacter sp.]|uniref:hypothetical protein n=1 Tax=Arthrobacter sp. TaxID=1667 RepID=UPI003A93C1CF